MVVALEGEAPVVVLVPSSGPEELIHLFLVGPVGDIVASFPIVHIEPCPTSGLRSSGVISGRSNKRLSVQRG